MAKAGLTPDQRSYSIFDLPTFKLKKDEKARILVIETEFETEFRHWVEETGYVFCLGDYKTMLANGQDLPHCVLCQKAQQFKAISQGRRAFVTLMAQYRTNSKGQILTPYSFDIHPWVFGDDKFNDLLGKKEQWGDLRAHDLLVECTGEQYQKFRMDVLPEAIWLKDPNLKAQIAAAYKESRQQYAKDLRMLLGRAITEPERLTEIINTAAGTVTVPDYASQAEVESAFSDVGAPGAVPAAAPVEQADFSQLLEGPAEVPAEAASETVVAEPAKAPAPAAKTAPAQVAKVAPAKAPAPAAPAQAPGTVNFDDLLK